MNEIWTDVETLLEFLTEDIPITAVPHADAIFVFGHYEPMIARHAANLWKHGKSRYLIVSGKGRDQIPEGFSSEANFLASVMEAAGVPRKAIILERQATNTLENVVLGIAAAKHVGLTPRSVILCAMPPLLRRSRATFQKHFPDITAISSTFQMPSTWFTARRIRRLIGELERLDAYARKGDIAYVDVPDLVRSAADEIRHWLTAGR